jgi:tetrahydromethanopterin S-methyltransferase subunit G
MADLPPTPTAPQDFPDQWGFYLLQAINRLDDKINQRMDTLDAKLEAVQRDVNQRIDHLDAKIEAVQRDVHQRIDGLDAKIEAVQRDVDQRIDSLDVKFDQKLTNLQYWYWGTLVVIIMGFVTLLLTRP